MAIDLGDGTRNPERRQAAERGELKLFGVDPGLREYRKRTTIYAARVDEDFTVWTIEGRHEGHAGDYIAIGAAGELYPIAADIMQATYEPVAPEDPDR